MWHVISFAYVIGRQVRESYTYANDALAVSCVLLIIKLNRADLLYWIVMYSLQSICLWTLRQLIIVVWYNCISYTGFAFSVFLFLWCSWHIHHQIRCCVVLLSGTIWRFGCEKAVGFIKHNNIFSKLSSMHTTHLISLCGGGLIVVCVCYFCQSFVLWIANALNQICLFSHISTIV